MERRAINPWTWQNEYGFVQANEVSGVERVLFCSGQGSAAEDGALLHTRDMRAQALQAVDNLEAVLREAGLGLESVVRVTHYTTDVDRYLAEGWEPVVDRLTRAGCRFASTLIGVARLAFPEMLVEIEATAVA